MGRKYDLVIYGATGVTGKCTVLELVQLIRDKKIDPVTWAVAGRSGSRLKLVLKQVSAETGEDLGKIDVIEADADKPESLQNMARQCTLLITAVGPYRFFGEAVIKACVAEGTHCIDVSGEPAYLERMQVLYHDQALEKNIYIVGSCGLDSIPTDCGITYLQQKFEGDVNSVEMFIEFENKGNMPAKINFATWQSAIYGLAHAKELRALRKDLFKKPLPKPTFKLPERGTLHYSEIIKAWCLPFPGSDRSIVKRTQYHLFHEEKQRPAQMTAYFKSGSIISSLVMMFIGLVFGVLAQYKIGRYLLENYPGLFSFGYVTKDGIAKEEMEDVEFRITLQAEGWQEKLAEPSDQHSEPPNKKMAVVVQGRNPGYGATCIMMIQAALTILKETDKLPSKGGVYTPGAAFRRTSLIDRLNATGVTFTVKNST